MLDSIHLLIFIPPDKIHRRDCSDFFFSMYNCLSALARRVMFGKMYPTPSNAMHYFRFLDVAPFVA